MEQTVLISSETSTQTNSLSTSKISGDFELLLKIGDKFFQEGKLSDALDMFKQALTNIVPNEDKNRPERVIIYRKIGLACFKKADYAEAYDFLTKALELKQSLKDKDLLGIERIKIDLGDVLFAQGKVSEAQQNFEASFETILKHYGEENIEMLVCSHGLARLYENQGKYAKALKILEKTIQICLKMDSSKIGPELAKSYFLMGSVYESMAEYAQALVYTEKALKLTEELYGHDNLETAGCYNMMGVLYHDKYQYKKALLNYEIALQIRLKLLGENHPKVADSYTNIGNIYGDLKEDAKALENYKKSLKINSKVYGKNHPELSIDYNNIATIYQSQGDFKEALNYFKESLNIRIQASGEDHPDLSMTYQNIAAIYTSLGNFNKAEVSFAKALKINEKYFGCKHPEAISLYNNIGNLYRAQMRYGDAFVNYTKTIRNSSFEDGLETLAEGIYNLGCLFQQMKDVDRVLTYTQKASLAYGVIFGKKHNETLESMRKVKLVEKASYRWNTNSDSDL